MKLIKTLVVAVSLTTAVSGAEMGSTGVDLGHCSRVECPKKLFSENYLTRSQCASFEVMRQVPNYGCYQQKHGNLDTFDYFDNIDLKAQCHF